MNGTEKDTNMKVTKEQIEKYRNPDLRCTYPFTPDPCGYCWSYAHHVDGTKGYEDMEAHCKHCDMWTESDKKAIAEQYRQVRENFEKKCREEKP